MEDPGETGAHPLGATNLNLVPGHQQKEKLVKLGGQPGTGGGRGQWQDGGGSERGSGAHPRPLLRSGCLPPGRLQTHCMTHLIPAGPRQVGPNNQLAL